MGIFDKFKNNQRPTTESIDTDGLPNMQAQPITLAEIAKQAKAHEKDFRGRENAAINNIENEGLPSVNRRTGNNKMVTIIGFIFILCVATWLIVVVNSDKTEPKKTVKPQEERITNNLPPLIAPPAPPPITITPTTQTNTQVPSINSGSVTTATQPIPLQGTQPHAMDANGKPILDWTDRKMGGSLLVTPQMSAKSAATNRATSTPSVEDNNSNNEFSSRLEPTPTKGVSAAILPDRNFLITKGTSLDCALETALDSTVPGLTTCRLTRDVYSDNGQILLLDRGSQLVGEYQGGLKQGQVRLFVLWTRAKTPNGVVVSLNSPGTDALGRSGLEGWVDNHFAERFGAAILMSFIKDSVAAIVNQRTGVTNIYGSTGDGGEKVVEKILESTVNIPPTIIKNEGDHIQVMVARDLDFSSVYGLQAKQ